MNLGLGNHWQYACSGFASKYSDNLAICPGYEGGGSVDREVNLSVESIRALKSYKDFMVVISLPHISTERTTMHN